MYVCDFADFVGAGWMVDVFVISNSYAFVFLKSLMASTSGDSWMKEYNDATKLADDINGMISEKTAMSGSGPDSQRHFSAVRRKITILGTRLDSLESLLSKPPSKKSM